MASKQKVFGYTNACARAITPDSQCRRHNSKCCCCFLLLCSCVHFQQTINGYCARRDDALKRRRVFVMSWARWVLVIWCALGEFFANIFCNWIQQQQRQPNTAEIHALHSGRKSKCQHLTRAPARTKAHRNTMQCLADIQLGNTPIFCWSLFIVCWACCCLVRNFCTSKIALFEFVCVCVLGACA